MPTPTSAQQALSSLLAGRWIGEETMHPSPMAPAGATGTGHVHNAAAVDGFIVVQEYEQRRGEHVNYRAHGVFWHDAAANEIEMTWWDTMGQPPARFRGTLTDRVLRLGLASPQGHLRATWDFSTPGTYTYAMEVSPDGAAWFPFMDGHYRRAD